MIIKRIIFIVLFLCVSFATHDKSKIINLKVSRKVNLIIKYENSVLDTIPKEALRIIGKNRIEYWNKDSTIIHIEDHYDLDSVTFIFFTRII